MSSIYDFRLRVNVPQDENHGGQALYYPSKLSARAPNASHRTHRVHAAFPKHIEPLPLNSNDIQLKDLIKSDPDCTTIDSETLNLVNYIRQPEKLRTSSGLSWLEMFAGDQTLHDSANSLHVEKTRPFQQVESLETFVPITVRPNKLLPISERLDLSPLMRSHLLQHDAVPFFNCERYETRLEPDDYEGICLAILENEILRITENEQPIFERQLELNEIRTCTRWYHYPLYYLFGIDRTGFFALNEIKKDFCDYPWSRFTRPRPDDVECYFGKVNEDAVDPLDIPDFDTKSEMSLDLYI